MKVETTIVEEIQRRQLIWYGHISEKMEDTRIPKQIFKWRPTEKRKRGRPRDMDRRNRERAVSERNLQPGDWKDRRG